MKLPKNYIPENQLKSAWLMLQEVKDKNGNAALQVCSKESIARCLLDMVLQGLSPVKKQVYFIPYADKLTCVRSYFGTVQLAKQSGGLIADPVANVIYEGDEFVYEIDPATGITKVIRHSQKLENVNLEKIRGAYCILQRGDRTEVTVMTMAQIRKSWEQGAAKGASPAHRNFTDEMCKKTVIGRACKMAINSSDDAWLYEDMKDDENLDTAAENRNETVRKAPTEITTETVEFEEINAPAAPQPEPQTAQEKPKKSEPGRPDAAFGDPPKPILSGPEEPVQTYSNNPAKDGARLPGF
jgi:recombination protein RecT